jgi:hypothetical protein
VLTPWNHSTRTHAATRVSGLRWPAKSAARRRPVDSPSPHRNPAQRFYVSVTRCRNTDDDTQHAHTANSALPEAQGRKKAVGRLNPYDPQSTGMLFLMTAEGAATGNATIG